jgi:hypothetical protein
MDRFVAHENVERFRRQLASEPDAERRRHLEALLAEAEQDVKRAEEAHRLNPT